MRYFYRIHIRYPYRIGMIYLKYRLRLVRLFIAGCFLRFSCWLDPGLKNEVETMMGKAKRWDAMEAEYDEIARMMDENFDAIPEELHQD